MSHNKGEIKVVPVLN